MQPNILLTKEVFSLQVERLLEASRIELSILDAIVTISNNNNIEIDVVPKLLTQNLKKLLEIESQKMNLIRKSDVESIFDI